MTDGYYDFSDLRFRPEAYRDQQGRVHEVQRADMTFQNGIGVRVRLGVAVKGSDGVNRYQTRIMRDGEHWVLNPMTKCGPAYWCTEAKVSYLMRQAQEYRSLRGTLNPSKA